MTAPERIWAASVTENYGEWQTTIDGLPRPTEYIRADLYAALEAQLAARTGGVKPLDEDDYEEIISAAAINMREATSGIRGQVVTVQDNIDWWVMKETERRILAALEAAPPAPKVTEAMVPFGFVYEHDGMVYDARNPLTLSKIRQPEHMRREPWTETMLYTITVAQEAGKP